MAELPWSLNKPQKHPTVGGYPTIHLLKYQVLLRVHKYRSLTSRLEVSHWLAACEDRQHNTVLGLHSAELAVLKGNFLQVLWHVANSSPLHLAPHATLDQAFQICITFLLYSHFGCKQTVLRSGEQKLPWHETQKERKRHGVCLHGDLV